MRCSGSLDFDEVKSCMTQLDLNLSDDDVRAFTHTHVFVVDC